MRRRLFAVASAISLLLCAADVVLGLRSYSSYDDISFGHNRWQIGVKGFAPGGQVLYLFAGETGLEQGFAYYHFDLKSSAWYGPYPVHHVGRLGFAHTASWWSLWFPAWGAWIATIVLPALWFIRFPWKKRRVTGFCFNCGYSLTGNTSGICPECGTPVAEKVGVKA